MPYELREQFLELDADKIYDNEDLMEKVDHIFYIYEMDNMFEKDDVSNPLDMTSSIENTGVMDDSESEFQSSEDNVHGYSDNSVHICQARKKLWRSRNFIYSLMESGKYVSKALSVFRLKVKDFLREFKNQISDDEEKFWQLKLLITNRAVSTYNKKNCETAQDVTENEAAVSDIKTKNAPPPYGVVSLAIGMKSEAEIAELKKAINNGEEAQRLADLWQKEPDGPEVEIMISRLARAILGRESFDQNKGWNSKCSDNGSVEIGVNSSSQIVEKFFDNVRDYEEKCSNLPAVPGETDPDEVIETQLLKLKFFNKTWVNNKTK